jgi:hypothetical protein
MPLDVAHDDQLWADYLHWLSHFRVARDRTQALLTPSKWPALESTTPVNEAISDRIPAPAALRLEQRMLVLGATWPDRDFIDPDVFATEICTEPSSPSERTALAQDMALVVGAELVARMLRVADVTGHTFDEVYQHLTTSRLGTFPTDDDGMIDGLRPAIGVDHLELLAAGQVPADLQTLIEVSEALHLVFGPHGWRIENPRALASKIRRSMLIEELTMLIQQMPLVDAEETVVEARLRLSHGQTQDEAAADDPETFESLLAKPPVIDGNRGPDMKYRTAPPEGNPMRALYRRLIEDPGPTVTLGVAEIDQWVREAATARGVKPDGRRTGHDGGLPNGALDSPSWWTNGYSRGHTQVRVWQAAGFQVQPPKLDGGMVKEVVFVERPGRTNWHKVRDQIHDKTYRRPSADAQEFSDLPPLERLRFGWQTRAANLPGALADRDVHFAWMDRIMLATHRNIRLMTNPPISPTRRWRDFFGLTSPTPRGATQQ